MKPLKRKDIKPGLRINHLGTIYEVTKIKRNRKTHVLETVTVTNPATGFIGTYEAKLLLKHSRRAD